MKSSNKSSLITGVILIALSALFTISLLLLPFDYGYGNLGSSNMFTGLGRVLYSAYGFSSILIPVFLLISGLSCFATIWTSKKTMRLLTAIVPFFTAVFTEKVCRSILAMGNSNSNIVILIIAILIGLILIVIEYMGAGFFAETINQKLFHSPKTNKDDKIQDSKTQVVFDPDTIPVDETIVPETDEERVDTAEVEMEQEPVIENVFEADFAKRDQERMAILKKQEEEKALQQDVFASALSKVTPEEIVIDESADETTNSNPASVITQEEYAALIPNPDDEEPAVEEIVWNNLPTPPESLPPEYQDEDTYESDEPTISPDFYDMDMSQETMVEPEEDDAFEEDIEDDTYLSDDIEFEEDIEIEKPEEPFNLTAAAATVFDRMDLDIQKEQPEPVKEEKEPSSNKYGKKGPYVIPTNLLTAYKDDQYWIIDDATKQASVNLKQTLSEFNIDAEIIGIKKGPVVTMFELLPAPGVKLSKIVALQDNIALSLAASSVRIVAPIPGKQAVGIEVPNKKRSVVGFRELIEMKLPEWDNMAVPVILGKDILGKAQLIDLVKTPHMLIAGATGSGKSVCVNSLILSILYKRSYRDVKLILVDPKVVELKLYNNIPHLLTPVITEPKKALQALQYCLCEMERRYALLDSMGVRDISSYNQRIKEREIATEKLPYIVVIIDEFADLMATSGKELESIVARLTAMSRAVGIHLVLATQRPSVNVITGLIKANIPSRIAFMVASRTDSNIIIDSVGAEKLLGRGDMLYASAVDPNPVRIQGTFVSDQEVENTVEAVKEYGEPDYIDDEIFIEDDEGSSENLDLFGNPYDEDPLYDQALEIVVQAGKASASYIQRRLKIGYNRAARLVEEMEERGIVGPANGSKPREIIHMP